jgi:hypothetical protein
VTGNQRGARARRAVIAVEGPSGAGKSEAVRRAAATLGAVVLPEAVERIRPSPSIDFRSTGELRRLERALLEEEGRRFRDARRRAGAGQRVIADTGFLGPISYTAGLVREGVAPRTLLDDLVARAARAALRDAWGLPDVVVALRTPAHLRRQRAAGDPVGHPAALRDRHERVGRFEARLLAAAVAPVLGPRFRTISGSGRPSVVAARLARVAARSTAPPRSPADALRALGAVATFGFGSPRSPSPRRRGNR